MYAKYLLLYWLSLCAITHGQQTTRLFSRQFQPIFSAISSIFQGNGLVQASLGTLRGFFGQDQEFDYVVIGGGTAGNAIGYRLAEAGFKVAIVEAGTVFELSKPGFSTIPGFDVLFVGSGEYEAISAADWKFETAPQPGAANRKIHIAQGKCVGGTSAWNFMIHHRGPKGMYDQWAEVVGDDSYRLVLRTLAGPRSGVGTFLTKHWRRLDNFEEFYKKSVTISPPDTSKRPSDSYTSYDKSDFAPPGESGPVQVGYSNYVSPWASWLERGLRAVGLRRTDGFNHGYLLGYYYTQTTIRQSDATRSSSAEYVYSAMKKQLTNLKIFTNTDASRIIFDDNKKATGVKVRSIIGSEYTLKAKNEVILSGGAFKSPQLLMLSGIGPEETLNQFGIPVVASLPGVGQNMWDHIFFGPSYAVKLKTMDSILHNPIDLAAAAGSYFLTHDGILSSNGVDLVGFEKLPRQYRNEFSEKTEQSLHRFPNDWPEVEFLAINGFVGTFATSLAQPLDGKQYATIVGALVAPLSRGNVTIRSTSVRDQPVINPNWLTDKADQDVAIALVKRIRDVWRTPELQSITNGPEAFPGMNVQTDDEILDYVRKTLMTIWHPSCTCKMGKKNDRMAVVDNLARVHGVHGLRVVDASAFPILLPGHPSATVYALAEKIAHSIVQASK